MQQVCVGPRFQWTCPICGSESTTNKIPLVVDRGILAVLDSHRPNSKKKYFVITKNGQLRDDSGSESEMESEETFEEESP